MNESSDIWGAAEIVKRSTALGCADPTDFSPWIDAPQQQVYTAG
jgi:hypothetical protein